MQGELLSYLSTVNGISGDQISSYIKTVIYFIKGRNSYAINLVTKGLKYLTWQDAYTCLVDESLPHSLRANYCHLIISTFLALEWSSLPNQGDCPK